ncbi:hypothetical protein AAVH_01603 [Aphelenchoides avenae]|nr:hypothetical protein AAVH_01603 [Aphelenchus avenae]
MRSTEPSPRRYATLGSRESGYGVRPAGAVPLDGGVRFMRGALSAERFDALMQQRAQQFRGADLGQSQMAAMEQRYRSQSRGRTGVFASGSPQGVSAAPTNGGPGRASRFDSYYQQQPIGAGAAAAFEAVERPRSAHSNGRGIPAVQSSDAYIMSNLDGGRVGAARRTPSATLQPAMFATSPEVINRRFADPVRSISRDGVNGLRTPSQTGAQRAEVYLPHQHDSRNEQRANCQFGQQQPVALQRPYQPVAAFNINQLPAASVPRAMPPRDADLCQTVIASPREQGYSPPQKRQMTGYPGSNNNDYCTFDEEYCPVYQEGGEQFGAQLAPFIPQEELFQLSDSLPSDLQNLFPEIEFSEFFAADVPPSKSQPMNAPVAMKRNHTMSSVGFSSNDVESFYDALAQQAAS